MPHLIRHEPLRFGAPLHTSQTQFSVVRSSRVAIVRSLPSRNFPFFIRACPATAETVDPFAVKLIVFTSQWQHHSRRERASKSGIDATGTGDAPLAIWHAFTFHSNRIAGSAAQFDKGVSAMRVIKALLIIVAILVIGLAVSMGLRRSVAPPTVLFVGMTNRYHEDRKDALFWVSNAADVVMRIDFTPEVKTPNWPVYESTNPYPLYQVSLAPHHVTNLIVRTPSRRYRGAWRLRVENHQAFSDLDLRRDQWARSLYAKNSWLARLVSPKRKSQVSFTEELNQ